MFGCLWSIFEISLARMLHTDNPAHSKSSSYCAIGEISSAKEDHWLVNQQALGTELHISTHLITQNTIF